MAMGLLIDGRWHDRWYDTASSGGRFQRQDSSFRHWIVSDGDGNYLAQPGRYHLYVSYACPWAHRALIFRVLKGLQSMVSVSAVHWLMGEQGWRFAPDDPELSDSVNGTQFLHQVYTRADPHYTGRVTVPVLWDKQRNTIVNNESADIIRIFNSAFDQLGARPGDYYPRPLRDEIDAVNERVYHNVNNGVYKAGFATTQDAYEEAVEPLFETLEWLERRLSGQRYLVGDQLTEADWRLFTTLVRFDPVYVGHFKCNRRRLIDYPNLWAYTRELYQQPGIAATVNMTHIKNHYYQSHGSVNPTGIVPAGPELDFSQPHGRGGHGRDGAGIAVSGSA